MARRANQIVNQKPDSEETPETEENTDGGTAGIVVAEEETALPPKEVNPEPEIVYLRVMQPAKVLMGGVIVQYHAGKIVNDRDYDLPALYGQGVRMKECNEIGELKGG